MMGRIWGIVGGLASVLMLAGADPGPAAPWANPVDFKVEVGEFALGTRPVTTSQVVTRAGRAYLFTEGNDEVIVIDPQRSSVELVEFGRRIRAVISFGQLAESKARLKAALSATVEKREGMGGRSNAELARMTRDLIDPRFRVEGAAGSARIRLINPTVEVDATGEPDADPTRLAFFALCLDTVADLGYFRVPSDLPPFPELDAISTLARDRRLRPTELSYLYRLAGPPRRFRRTYRLVPALTDREREAISRIDTLRNEAPLLRYDRYAKAILPK
ncbi:hypothetical protein TA3x_005179 [Tundrisphaera sp. TA3]|uniref:hypothetical protein n=1 Tax=Tundrisphaera sp. TA3 TaxID=3435775 RepID=UPI003EB9E454